MPRSSTGWATNGWEDNSKKVSTVDKNGWQALRIKGRNGIGLA